MKKILYSFTFLMIVMPLMLVACGGNSGTNNSTDQTTSEDAEEKVVLKVAGVYPPEHPSTENLMKFKDEVEKETNGEVELEVYPANQLGDYTVVYEEIIRGTIDMGLITVPTQYDSNLNINYVNYLATSYEDAEKAFSPGSFIYNANEEIHEGLGAKFLGFHFEGMTGIGSVKELKNITDPGEDKGIMLRVPSIDMLREGAVDLGFRTVSIDYSELYQALQTGVADGWAGGSPVPNYTDVGDVINYYYAYNNWFETTHLLMNNNLWNELDEDVQEIIKNASNELYLRSLEITQENDQLYKEKLQEEYGVEIVEFSHEELNEIAEHIRKTNWPKLEEMLDKEYFEGLMEFY